MKRNPLVRQSVLVVTVNYWFKHKITYTLYKKGIGYKAMTAKGEVLPKYLLSKKPFGTFMRSLLGIKSVRTEVIDTEGIHVYYKRILDELEQLLYEDEYWDRRNKEVFRLWRRVSEVLYEITEEEVEVIVPELVTHFYNFCMPKDAKRTQNLVSKLIID